MAYQHFDLAQLGEDPLRLVVLLTHPSSLRSSAAGLSCPAGHSYGGRSALDAVVSEGVPIVFATGYDASSVPDRYAGVPRCDKPAETRTVIQALRNAISALLRTPQPRPRDPVTGASASGRRQSDPNAG